MSDELLKYYQDQIDQCLRLQDALTQASVMIRSRAKALSDSCLEAAEQFRREAEDHKMILEEVKIERDKQNGSSQ